MKAGTTLRCSCESCDTEFEVTLEPKAVTDKKSAAGIKPQKILCCPFCGSNKVTTDED